MTYGGSIDLMKHHLDYLYQRSRS